MADAPATSAGRVERRVAGGLEVLTWPELGALGVDACVTTRHGGVSGGPYRSLNLGLHVGDEPDRVVENRRRAAAALGAELDDLVFGHQVHGARAEVVTESDRGRGARSSQGALGSTDALVTARHGVVLVTLVADCSPILLVDPVARVVATAHAGWRGALGGTAVAAVARMASLGASPERVHAFIGPTVARSSYEVGPEVEAAARAALGSDATLTLVPRGGRWLFDVAAANRLRLLEAGLLPGHVRASDVTTDDPCLFSDRAERPCGRFGLLARIR